MLSTCWKLGFPVQNLSNEVFTGRDTFPMVPAEKLLMGMNSNAVRVDTLGSRSLRCFLAPAILVLLNVCFIPAAHDFFLSHHFPLERKYERKTFWHTGPRAAQANLAPLQVARVSREQFSPPDDWLNLSQLWIYLVKSWMCEGCVMLEK